MDEIIKLCAKYLVLVPVLVNLYIIWRLDRNGRRRMFLIILAGGILSLILAGIGSQLFSDPRPEFKDHVTPLIPHGNENGFPSDHTLLASFLAFVAYTYHKRIGYGLLAVALIIGWARVAAHIHHAIDIVGSFVITAVAYFAVTWFLDRYLGSGKSK
jgi:membrane-associated phospholipid phosphatase